MLGVLAAAGVCAVVLWLPGLAALGVLLPGTSRLARIAAAPALSLGLLYALAGYLDLVGVRVDWASVALPMVLVAAVVLGVRLRHGIAVPRLRWEHLVLAVSVIVALWLWCYAVGSPTTVPTYDDGANAAIFTHRIDLLGTLAPDRIIATDLGDGAGGVSYYPLALHLVASFLVAVTGAGAGLALHVVTALLVAVCLPVGAFALTRRLVGTDLGQGRRPAVAAAAAGALAAVLPGLPWGQLPWGALAMVSGIALLPGLLLLVRELVGHPWQAGVALGVATAGLFGAHSSEVVTGAVLGAGMVAAIAGRRAVVWRDAFAGGSLAVVTALLLLGPVLPTLSGGLSERAAGTPGPSMYPVQALNDGWMSLIGAPELADEWGVRQRYVAWAVTLLVVLGVWAARRARPVLGMAVASGLLAVLAWACLLGSPLAHTLATPWYANGYRLLATLTVPLLVLAGTGVALLAGRHWGRILAVGGVLALAVAAPAVAVSGVIGSRTYAAYSVVTVGDRDAFAWLGAHVPGGERVLNDSHDGSMWMYPVAGVAPVFGPKSDLWQTPAWQDRWYLLQHAAQLGVDGRARRIADELDVSYAFVGDRVIYGEARQLDRSVMVASGAWREVYRSGSAVVLQRVGT